MATPNNQALGKKEAPESASLELSSPDGSQDSLGFNVSWYNVADLTPLSNAYSHDIFYSPATSIDSQPGSQETPVAAGLN